MTRSLRTLLALLTLSSSALAASADTQRLTLHTVSVGSIGECEAEVSRRLDVCKRDAGCERVEFEDEARLVIPTGGALLLSATVSYVEQGVFHGDSAVHRITRFDDGQRVVQSLELGPGCSRSWSYELELE
jgi:hypothetical protein